MPHPNVASITVALSACVAAVVPKAPRISPVNVVDVLAVYSIISSSIFKKPVFEKDAAESTVTLVAEAVRPLPSFIAVDGRDNVVPPKTPAPQPVPKKFVSRPVLI